MGPHDYKRFLNFLAAHDCNVDFREFRHGNPAPQRAPRLLPPLPAPAGQPCDGRDGEEPAVPTGTRPS
jgi:hypothetical protein